MIVQRFNLNLIPNQSPVIVHVNQYDTGTGRLIATLYEGNEPYSPSGTAVIQGTKPDGHGFQYTATLDGNVVTADLTEQMAPVAGDVRTQIVVTESSGVTGTFAFIMRVQPSALPSDTDMSESDYQYIEEAIREAQEAVQTAQEATETAQEAVERAQEAITETQENAEDSEAWAQGTRGGIPVEPTDPTYEHNAEYWAQYAERYAQGGLHYKGSILFANIPTTGMREGDMYDITDDFTTDSRFEEGAGIEVKGGTNIAWNSDNKWDILALPYIPKTTFNGRSGSILPMAGDYDSKKILLSSALHIGGETQSDAQEALEALSNDGVKSFNGRSGSVLPMAGDYDSEKILLASVLHIGGETQENVQKALEALSDDGVKSFNGRSGSVLPMAGDYSAEQVDYDSNQTVKQKIDALVTKEESDIAGQQSLLKDTVGWTGKNKFPLTLSNLKSINTSGTWNGNSYTHNNVTYTITAENDIVTNIASSGTASTSGGSNLFLWANGIPSWMDAGKDYILSGCASDGSVSTYSIQYNNWTEGATYQKIDNGNGVTIRKITDSITQKIRIWVRQNTNASGLNFKPMVRDASITDPTYEPYHESVEVMYEEEIHGVNLLKNATGSQTINGVTFTVNTDGSVTVNGTATANCYYNVNNSRNSGDILQSGTFIMTSKAFLSGSYGMYFQERNADDSAWEESLTDTGNGVVISHDASRKWNVTIYVNSGKTLSNVKFYPMIRKADIDDPTYRPYNPQAIQNQLNSVYENGAVNHLDNKATNRTISGITFTVDDNKIIYANGTSANSGDTPQIAMPVSLPKGRWAYSGCPDGGSDQKWDMILWDNTASSRLVEGSLFNSNDRLEFEITDANVNHSIDAYIRVKKGGVVCNNIAFKPMIAPASYTGHYVPYAMTNRELTEKINGTGWVEPTLNTTDFGKVSGIATAGLFYCVKSGICYVSGYAIKANATGGGKTIASNLPKTDGHRVFAPVLSTSTGAVIGTVFMRENATDIIGSIGTANVEMWFSFSYPVAQ